MDTSPHVIDKILNHRIYLHFLFWLLISLVIYVFFSLFLFDSFSVYLANLIAIIPSQIVLTYFLTYFLIPNYLLTRKYLLFTILFLIALYFSMVLSRALTIYIVEDLNQRGFEKNSIIEILTQIDHLLLRYLLPVILGPLIFIPIKLLKDRLEERTKIEELKKEKVNAQLKYLKAQIHPHFLFNTLNNLYLLTLEKRDQAPEVVLKLSNMLDYMLYQCDEPQVFLTKEIELINNYITLEKIRYDDNLELNFNYKLQNNNAKIAPLIILSLVENAFKHSGKNNQGKTQINISMQEWENTFDLTIKNSISTPQKPKTKKGIGLENMRTQLNLQYPDKHKLSIIELKNSYEVKLKILLT